VHRQAGMRGVIHPEIHGGIEPRAIGIEIAE
jgi:hypothetical protein